MTATFTILGSPRTKKTSQRIVRNRATGKMLIISAKAKADWETTATEQLRAQRGPTTIVNVRRKGKMIALPVQFSGPVRVTALFYRDRDIGDATGFYQALADALEKSGVLANDRQIEDWDGSRRLVDRANPRVEVTVEAL